jgi:hypothetical protein
LRARVTFPSLGLGSLLTPKNPPRQLHHILGIYGCYIIERSESELDQSIFSSSSVHSRSPLALYRHNIHMVEQTVRNDVSSTKVRLFIRKGMSVKYLIPTVVIHYINHHGLYRKSDKRRDSLAQATPSPNLVPQQQATEPPPPPIASTSSSSFQQHASQPPPPPPPQQDLLLQPFALPASVVSTSSPSWASTFPPAASTSTDRPRQHQQNEEADPRTRRTSLSRSGGQRGSFSRGEHEERFELVIAAGVGTGVGGLGPSGGGEDDVTMRAA